MPRVYLGLGANVGDRRRNLRTAIAALPPAVEVVAVSALYETPALTTPEVGPQPDFLNAVVAGHTDLEPEDLLRHVKAIERAAGRGEGPRWGPRPLDIDILLYGERQVTTDLLTIPHAGLFQRAFVLAPLADLAPDLTPPGAAVTVRDALKALGEEGEVTRVAGPEWAASA